MTTSPCTARAVTRSEMATASDGALLLAVRNGDATAYGELYRRYAHEARRFARSLAAADDVDDIVAEAFAKMLRALKAGRGPVDRAAPYLMVTVRTSAATLQGRRARARATERQVSQLDRGDDRLPLGADQRLEAAFGSLSVRWRQVIWWGEVEGLTPAEIGERLDLKPTAVSALAYRARRALRQAYERTSEA